MMRSMTRRVLVAALLSLTLSSVASSGNFVGLYADAEGTQPCANVPPFSAKTLYVIAKLDAVMSAGLSAAEFRIEIGNLTGWWASYTAPGTANLVIGDPIDSDPDPNAGGGIRLAFPMCQAPLNGMVNLGTITMFNITGSSTSLRVKRHSTPSNPTYMCPLFVLCDDPVFSKLCMSAGEATSCSTLTVPKPGQVTSRVASDDPVVFELGLNGAEMITPPVPPESTFTDTVTIRPGNELWVMGQPVIGPNVSCQYDGFHLTIGGVELREIPTPEPSVEALTAEYADIPRVSACLASGITIREAVAVYKSEFNALQDQVCVAFTSGGDAAMRQVLQSSPLVAEILDSFGGMESGNGTILVRYHGGPATGISNCTFIATQPHRPSFGRAAAEARVGRIRHKLQQPEALLLLVFGTGMVTMRGDDADAARAQLEHVHRTGTIDGLPPGPLGMHSEVFSAILLEKASGDK